MVQSSATNLRDGAGAAKVKIADAQTADLVYTVHSTRDPILILTSEELLDNALFSVTQNGAAGTNTFVGGRSY